MTAEIDYAKRNSIRLLFFGGLGFIATGCQTSPSIVLHRDSFRSLERSGDYEPGDIVENNGYYFLPRFNLYVPIPDPEFYARSTKMSKYDRKILSAKHVINAVKGELPKYEINVEEFSGVKDLMRRGGEAIDLWSGLGTNEEEEIKDFTDGDLNDELDSGTFFMQRREVKKKGFIFAQIFNFPYGVKEKLFDWRDTARPLAENIKLALYYTEQVQRMMPLSQRNGFAHSLGTIFLFEVAMEYPDWFNNLFFYSPCIRGVEFPNNLPVDIIKRHVKLIDDLDKRWKDADLQKRIKEFIPRFTKGGRKRLIEFRAQDDPFSSHIEGAEEYVLQSAGRNFWEAHAASLDYEEFSKISAEAIGGKVA